MGSGVKSLQHSVLDRIGANDEVDRDKENKFTFNPRISKYGAGFGSTNNNNE